MSEKVDENSVINLIKPKINGEKKSSLKRYYDARLTFDSGCKAASS